MTQPVPAPASVPAPPTAIPAVPAGERGWGKLILALVAFLLLPNVPQFRAFVPVDQTMLLDAWRLAGMGSLEAISSTSGTSSGRGPITAAQVKPRELPGKTPRSSAMT